MNWKTVANTEASIRALHHQASKFRREANTHEDGARQAMEQAVGRWHAAKAANEAAEELLSGAASLAATLMEPASANGCAMEAEPSTGVQNATAASNVMAVTDLGPGAPRK